MRMVPMLRYVLGVVPILVVTAIMLSGCTTTTGTVAVGTYKAGKEGVEAYKDSYRARCIALRAGRVTGIRDVAWDFDTEPYDGIPDGDPDDVCNEELQKIPSPESAKGY